VHLRHTLLVGAVLLFGIVTPASAGVSDSDLQKQYGDKVLTLRQFIPGAHLHFDAHGGSSTTERGPWTLDGQIRVTKISLQQGVVRISGQRRFLFYDPQSKQLRDVASVTKDDPEHKWFRKKVGKWQAEEGKVDIEVDCGNPSPEMADVVNAMNAVFLRPDQPLTDVVPGYWKTWFGLRDEPTTELANAARGKDPAVHRVGGAVSPPRATYDPDPKYSELARQAGYQGSAVIWLVVDTDGLPKHIRIQKPLGMGLDEQAIKSIQTWKFDPSMRNGEPVPVMINVQVNFKLY
jgi:TonB family protein